MLRRNVRKAILWLTLAWFLVIPLFWHFDLSKSLSVFFDAFEMAPLGLVHILIFYVLVFLCLYFKGFSLSILLLLSLYFPFIQIVNYPFLTYRDVYVHAAPVQTILADGTLNYTRDSNPGSWPGSFDLHGITSIATGTDLIVSNYVLYLAIVIVLALVLYCFAKRLEQKGFKLAGYGAVLFLCLFSNYLFDFNHFARSTFEFILLFLFFFCFIFLKGRSGYLLQYIFAIALIITHPFASFALIVFTIFDYLLTSTGKRSKKIHVVLFSILSFIGWFMFSAFERFREAGFLLTTFFQPQYVTPVTETFTAKASVPLWDSILREFFRYSQIGLLGIACAFTLYIAYTKFRWYSEEDDAIIGLASLVPTAIIILMALLLLPDWQISRFSAFAAFPAAFSFFVLPHFFSKNKRLKRLFNFKTLKKAINRAKKIFPILLLCFIIILSAGVMILRFEKNYYYGEITHPSELSCLSFFNSRDTNSSIAFVSYRTAVYAAYFNWRGYHSTSVVWYVDLNHMKGNSPMFLEREGQLINQSEAVIRGMRDEYDLSRFSDPGSILNTIDEEMINPDFNQIYSNGYYSVFKRSYQFP